MKTLDQIAANLLAILEVGGMDTMGSCEDEIVSIIPLEQTPTHHTYDVGFDSGVSATVVIGMGVEMTLVKTSDAP